MRPSGILYNYVDKVVVSTIELTKQTNKNQVFENQVFENNVAYREQTEEVKNQTRPNNETNEEKNQIQQPIEVISR